MADGPGFDVGADQAAAIKNREKGDVRQDADRAEGQPEFAEGVPQKRCPIEQNVAMSYWFWPFAVNA